MTYREAAQAALDVQDASNLSGVVHTFAKAVSAIWDERDREGGHGTTWVNGHSIVTLFLSKLNDLNSAARTLQNGSEEAWEEVKRIAQGKGA